VAKGCQSEGSGISSEFSISSYFDKKSFQNGILTMSFSSVRECSSGVGIPAVASFTPYDWCVSQSFQSPTGALSGSYGVGYCLESGLHESGSRFASGLFLDTGCSSPEFYPNYDHSENQLSPLLTSPLPNSVPYYLDCEDDGISRPTVVECVGGNYLPNTLAFETDPQPTKPEGPFLVLNRYTDPLKCVNSSYWTEIFAVGSCIPQPSNAAYFMFSDVSNVGDQLSFTVSTFSDSSCQFPSSALVENIPGCSSANCIFTTSEGQCMSSGSVRSWSFQLERPKLPPGSALHR